MSTSRFFLACAVAAFAASPVAAQVPSDMATAEILPGWRAADGSHVSAIRITLAPGWKTYWRAPGDAGIPPQFEWSGSRNMASVATHWPVPHVFYQNGMRSVGYAEEVVIPLEIAPIRAGEEIDIDARLNIGVCEEVCVPVSLSLRAVLPSPGDSDPTIVSALASGPMSAADAGVSTVTCGIEPIADGVRITARIAMPPLGGDEVAVLELADPSVWVSEADTSRSGDTLVAVAEMVPPNGQPFLVNRSDVRITVLSGQRGVDIRGCTGL